MGRGGSAKQQPGSTTRRPPAQKKRAEDRTPAESVSVRLVSGLGSALLIGGCNALAPKAAPWVFCPRGGDTHASAGRAFTCGHPPDREPRLTGEEGVM